MAKLTKSVGIGGNRDSARGPGYRISMWRGTPRVYAKQTHRKKKISPKQKEAMFQFAALSEVAKAINSTEIWNAQVLSKGTQFLWRDLIFMTTSGRGFRFQLPDGTKVFSEVARTTVSDLIEAISQVPGAMLYRGPNWWQPIPPGETGQVLTYDGPNKAPYWGPGPSGGGGFGMATILDETISIAESVGKGIDVTTWQDVNYAGAQVYLNMLAGVDYQVYLCLYDGAEVQEVLATSSVITTVTTGEQFVNFPFAAPATVPAMTQAFVAVVAINQSGTYRTRVGLDTNGVKGFPFVYPQLSPRLFTTSIGPGTPVDNYTSGKYTIAPWWA